MKIRVISALIAIIILIPFIIAGGYPFAFLMSILAIIAYKEFLDLKKSHNKIPNLIKILGLVSLLYLILGNYGINSLYFAMSYSRLVLPLLLMLIPTVFYKKDKYTTQDAIYLLGSIFLLGILFNLIIIIRNINIYLLLYLLSITIVTDTFAYTIGSLIGRHKMVPTISPLKSWEGFFAGVISSAAISSIIYANLLASFNMKVLIVTIILSIVGQIGDLFFSKIKRENGIKDFSNLMPGHGGILDRLDSLVFVIFTYVIIVYFL